MKPNVIFLMDDQHRWDALGVLNPQVQTPHLDHLIHEGLHFSQAVCQAPMCIASRNSMMLGLYANQTGVLRNEPGIPDEALPTLPLPEVFKRAGYQTAGFGKTHWGLACSTRGFDHRFIGECPEIDAIMMKDAAPLAKKEYQDEADPYGGGEENNLGYIGCSSQVPEGNHRDGWVFNQCQTFIENDLEDDKPLFLYLSFLKPHAGHNVPESFEDGYDTKSIRYADQPPWDQEISPHAKGNNRNESYEDFWSEADEETWKTMTMRYYANCTWIDSMFGRTLKALEKQGRLDNTLIVYCTDHGEMLGERYFRFNKYCLYDSSVRVPIILSGSALPEALRGKTDSRPAELLDLYTTLTQVAGETPDSKTSGEDLLSPSNRAGSFCAVHERSEEAAFMWRTESHKLILVMKRKSLNQAHTYSESDIIAGEFYNLNDDPKEWNNLFDDPGSLSSMMLIMKEQLLEKLSSQILMVEGRQDGK